MSSFSKFIYTTLFVLLLLVAGVRPASAHHVVAVLSLDPSMPVAGQPSTLLITIADPYGAPIPGVVVRASAGPMDEPPPAMDTLRESGPSDFTGELQMPEGIVAAIRLEVDLPDGPWHAIFPVRLGEDWFQVTDFALELQPGRLRSGPPEGPSPGQAQGQAHGQDPSAAPSPWRWIAPPIALLAALWIGLTVRKRS